MNIRRTYWVIAKSFPSHNAPQSAQAGVCSVFFTPTLLEHTVPTFLGQSPHQTGQDEEKGPKVLHGAEAQEHPGEGATVDPE